MKARRAKRKLRAVPLPMELALAIDKLVGKRNRSAFATKIIERAVHTLQRLPAISEYATDNHGHLNPGGLLRVLLNDSVPCPPIQADLNDSGRIQCSDR